MNPNTPQPQHYLGSFVAPIKLSYETGPKQKFRMAPNLEFAGNKRLKDRLFPLQLTVLVYPQEMPQNEMAQPVGFLFHAFSGIWYFLLSLGYVKLEGETLEDVQTIVLSKDKKRYVLAKPMKVNVYLLQKAIEEDFEMKILNYAERLSGVGRNYSFEESQMEVLKFGRISLLLVLDLMCVRKKEERKVKTEKQFEQFLKYYCQIKGKDQPYHAYLRMEKDTIKILAGSGEAMEYYAWGKKSELSICWRNQGIEESIMLEVEKGKYVALKTWGELGKAKRSGAELKRVGKPLSWTELAPEKSAEFEVFYEQARRQWNAWVRRQLLKLDKERHEQFKAVCEFLFQHPDTNVFLELRRFEITHRKQMYAYEIFNRVRTLKLKNRGPFYGLRVTDNGVTTSKATHVLEMLKQFFGELPENHEQSPKVEEQEEEEGEKEVNSLMEQMNQKNLREAATPERMKTELMKHQKQALSWMLYREDRIPLAEAYHLQDDEQDSFATLSSLWQEYTLLDNKTLYVNSFTGKISEHFVQVSSTKGGILADEMGLGKTLMALALVCHTLHPTTGTLIVLPKAVIAQWGKEIEKHTKNNRLRVHTYYSKTDRSKPFHLTDYDIVLTTYGILGIDYSHKFNIVKKKKVNPKNKKNSKKPKTTNPQFNSFDNPFQQDNDSSFEIENQTDVLPTDQSQTLEPQQSNALKSKLLNLFDYDWHRVILDEAHNIKGKTTNMCQAAKALKTTYRWCLTGTPMQNKYDDIFSLLQFLKVETFGEYFWWNTYVNKEENEEDLQNILVQILKPIVLRRTKKQQEQQQSELEEESIYVTLSEKERIFYQKLHTGTKDYFKVLFKDNDENKQYVHIFQIITKLRMACDHISMALKNIPVGKTLDEKFELFFERQKQQNKKNIVPENFKNAIIEDIKNGTINYCHICQEDDKTSFALAKCGHLACAPCFKNILVIQRKCPQCRIDLSENDLLFYEKNEQILEQDEDEVSTKILAVVQEIRRIKGLEEKCLVFTQWTDVINKISKVLKEDGIYHQIITGAQTVQQREKIIEEFRRRQHQTALLLSLKASSTGLNLTMANHVLIVDPWWNPAIEDQAIGRAHRIGQEKKVFIKRFICKNTIEERINELHERKRKKMQSALALERGKKGEEMQEIKYLLAIE